MDVLRDMLREPLIRIFLLLFAALIAFAIVLQITVWGPQHEAWVASCEELGGHVLTDHDTNVGVGFAPGANGGVGGPVMTTTSNTDYWCLSEDGRILDHRD